MQVQNPNYKERVLKHLEGQYFMKHIGFKMLEVEPGRTMGELNLEQIHKQQAGFAHGGLVATLADITAGFAAVTLVAEDQRVVTGELKISYLNPGVGKKLKAVGWVLKQGRKMNFCEAEVWAIADDKEKLIAKASATMVTIFPEDVR